MFAGKSYSRRQYGSAALISCGLALATLLTQAAPAAAPATAAAAAQGFVESSAEPVVGALLLSLALVSSALLGVAQEIAFRRCGNHIDEVSPDVSGSEVLTRFLSCHCYRHTFEYFLNFKFNTCRASSFPYPLRYCFMA